MSTGTAARFSVRELQAAADALAAGRFAATGHSTAPEQTEQFDMSDACERGERVNLARPVTGYAGAVPEGLGPLVRVRAASAGAGASTMTLALADAADAAGIRARVLDAAAPAWSGLLGATVTEFGAAEGWRRGRRGANVLIDRVEEPVGVPAEVPVPRGVDGVDVTVLDAGWTPRELAADPGAWVAAVPAQVDVLVTRRHGLALSQTEAALAALVDQLDAGRVVVLVVGAGRWSGPEFASAGPLLRRARTEGAVLFAPLLGARALPGLGPDPLPKQLTSPAQRLLERITTITGPLTADRT